jgi:hypothetical protein
MYQSQLTLNSQISNKEMESPASKKAKIELAELTPAGSGTSSFPEGTSLTPGVSGLSFFKEDAYDYSTVCLVKMPRDI